MRVERHVFGSIHGYGTLARSPGLSDADCRRLSSLSFGTPFDAAYPRSLTEKAAYWSRPLGPERRAVTRVLPGRPDDAGRPTLLFISCVVDAEDWNFALQGDAQALLRVRELWEWNGATRLQALELPDPAPGSWRFDRESAKRILGLVSLVELSWRAQQSVVIRDDQYSLIEAATVERLLPPSIRARYSAVYRSLNPELPATLNCLAAGVPLGSTGASRFLAEAKSPYAKELESEGFGEGEEPGLLLIGYEHFGGRDPKNGNEPAEGPNVKLHTGGAGRDARRGSASIPMFALTLCLLLVFAIGGAAGWMLGTSGGKRAKAVESVWAECLLRAVEMPAQTREQQIRTIEEIRRHIDEPAFATLEQRIDISGTVHKTAESVRMLKKAEEEITRVETDNPSTIRTAETTLATLEQERIGPTEMLRDWLAARRRPMEDRYAVVMERMRDAIEKETNELAQAAERLDTRLMEQAKVLRRSLDIIESGVADRPEAWIDQEAVRLEGLARDWQKKLDTLETKSKDLNTSEQSRQAEMLDAFAARLQELKTALDAGAEEHRRQVCAILQAVSREGEAMWGNLFGESIAALSDWILALPAPTSPEKVAELQKEVEDCEALADNIEKSVGQIIEQRLSRDDAAALRAVRLDAREMNRTIRKIKTLTNNLQKP